MSSNPAAVIVKAFSALRASLCIMYSTSNLNFAKCWWERSSIQYTLYTGKQTSHDCKHKMGRKKWRSCSPYACCGPVRWKRAENTKMQKKLPRRLSIIAIAFLTAWSASEMLARLVKATHRNLICQRRHNNEHCSKLARQQLAQHAVQEF